MADSGSGPRKVPTIPSWQQPGAPPYTKSTQPQPDEQDTSVQADSDAVERGRKFLQHDEIKDETHEKKIAYLEKKGLQADDIQKVLAESSPANNDTTDNTADMQTVFDSNTSTVPSDNTAAPSRAPIQPPLSSPVIQQPPSQPAPAPSPPTAHTPATLTPKQDLPPIITYPEFLLKPQKPPPLVTIDRLANAGYILAGISALTWGASKYLVAPMLESLTSARHDLSSSTLTFLTTLNTKLESTVSHVPYIPPLSHLPSQHHQKPSHTTPDDDDDAESIDSDPTELFHRDIATQTSPPPEQNTSRRSSLDSTDIYGLSSSTSNNKSKDKSKNATTAQSTRLRTLHTSLSSLLSSTSTHFSEDALKTSVEELQGIIDKVESNSTPLYTSYDWRSSGINASGAWGGVSATTTNTGTGSGAGVTKGAGKNESKREDQTEAGRFKAEIRALKGAFLSSRNFPSARPVVGSAGGR